MQDWITFPAPEQLINGEVYFIGRKTGMGCMFLGRGLNGKMQWTVKPGIAIKAELDDELKAMLKRNPEWVLVAIPPDADKRWKARKKVNR